MFIKEGEEGDVVLYSVVGREVRSGFGVTEEMGLSCICDSVGGGEEGRLLVAVSEVVFVVV